MESLAEEPWDVVICGTGLQQSLLALALSRSKKRVLHIDPNEYYGGHEAAFSLQEAESFVATAARSPSSSSSNDGDGGALSDNKDAVFQHASVWKHEDAASLGLSFPRAYSLALAPQIIHSRSKLLEQLVSSRAFRQVEFLAVGPFFVYDDGGDGSPTPKLSRIPSSREGVFSARSIPARSKRSLMKFLRFVTTSGEEAAGPGAGGEEESAEAATRRSANQPLADFLRDEFGLDEALRRYVLALTLSLDPDVSVADGLAAVRRHLASMGFFGPGFCAVYPKWGGLSEVAQVACRAQAVGGGVYMLGTGMQVQGDDADDGRVAVKLSNDITVQTSTTVTSRQEAASDGQAISRLVAVVNAPLQSLFEVTVEGAPTPAVAVVAFPPGSVTTSDDDDDKDLPAPTSPIYALVHSSDTGECPKGQCVIYLTTPSTTTAATQSPRAPDPESAQRLLDRALACLLRAVDTTTTTTTTTSPTALYKLRYVQTLHNNTPTSTSTSTTPPTNTREFTFPASPSPSTSTSTSPSHPLGVLAFDDKCLDAVKAAWELVTQKTAKEEAKSKGGDEGGEDEKGDEDVENSPAKEPQGDGDEEENEYMVFRDREGVGDDGNGYGDDVYD